MINKLRKTTIGGTEVAHSSAFTDEELRMAFVYLYRLQSLRYDQQTSSSGKVNYSIMPSEADDSVWLFISLNDDIPVCITPEFELAQMISMAKTALVVTETLKNLRMENIAI
ncbi:hypothetical protein Dacet_1034 [Denitrovibrio acetiphilus DSM 12809]|uniref:Uncharacterized protein n=1 Tax=Denitrovibrio acetiphilus (strain DSM 12809 / NBRC 114555 / N2460) TaxID=522772 RepID=D4H6U4_DENA2|nr:hypothetical protein [Denitrovibrio acetiphilus]ADD67810.1 hypothetical protein Dacet_1034 [Denitrovibrio acetiphilus DSM 12809]